VGKPRNKMTWKRKLAEEWLWFLCTVAFGCLVVLALVLIHYGGDFEGSGPAFLVTPLFAYVVVSIVRSIIWAIRQVRKKE
jgi:hypothetical protein